MDTFIANCNCADNCLNFRCSEFTPRRVTVENIGSVHWCTLEENGVKSRLVHMEPFSPQDWAILEKQYQRCMGVNIDEETVLVQEGV